MDADLATILGGSATVTEKLYAQAIQEGRTNAKALEDFRVLLRQHMQWFQTQYADLPPETAPTFDDKDRMYSFFLQVGMDARKQSMSTATTRATMDDVVDDAHYIANKLYAILKTEKAAGNL